MAMTGPPPSGDPLDRAAAQLRSRTPPGWIDTSDAIGAVVRTATRHSRPVAVGDAELREGGHGGRIRLAEQVIAAELRIAIDGDPGCEPRRIDLTVEDERCTAIRIEVAARYGTHLPTVATTVRHLITERLGTLLGAVAADVAVHIHVSDLTGPLAAEGSASRSDARVDQ